jgi:hypothetical protein
MSELSEVGLSSAGRADHSRFVPRWLMIFLCRLGWAEHPDAGEWQRAGLRLRETFLEDWTARSR